LCQNRPRGLNDLDVFCAICTSFTAGTVSPHILTEKMGSPDAHLRIAARAVLDRRADAVDHGEKIRSAGAQGRGVLGAEDELVGESLAEGGVLGGVRIPPPWPCSGVSRIPKGVS
jgi:hypothetical protein